MRVIEYPPAVVTNDAGTYPLVTALGPTSDNLVRAGSVKAGAGLRFVISANATDGSAGIFRIGATVISNGLSASIVPGSLSLSSDSDVPAWAVSLQAIGNTIVCSVTGDAAHIVTWSETQGGGVGVGLGAWWFWQNFVRPAGV